MVAEIGHLPRMLWDRPIGDAVAPPVTILMATRNGADFLPDQLASLAAQTDRNWQLWVSDDGSTDATRDMLAQFARSHPLRVLEGPRRGAAQNFMALLTHPELPVGPVAFADQDDVWLAGKLARARRSLALVPPDRPALYAAESILVDADLRTLARSRPPGIAPGFGNALVQNLFSGHTMVLNAAAVALARRAGLPAGLRFHDWWLYQLIAGAGGHLGLDPRPVTLYRQHGHNVLGAAQGTRAAIHRLRHLIGGDWGNAMRDHARALQQLGGLMTPQARGLIDAFLDGFPPHGPARAAAFRQHGLARAAMRDGIALQICACFGRV